MRRYMRYYRMRKPEEVKRIGKRYYDSKGKHRKRKRPMTEKRRAYMREYMRKRYAKMREAKAGKGDE